VYGIRNKLTGKGAEDAAFDPSPAGKGKSPVGQSRKADRIRRPAGARLVVRDHGALWAAVDAPFSRYADAIRSIKHAADMTGAVKSNKVIGITSSLPHEGKSTVAVALAQFISQVGGRTILIDCDLRNPSISEALAPGANTGLLEVLSGEVSLADAVWLDSSSDMEFLPTPIKAPLAHSNEILSSSEMKRLFDQLRQTYTHIIVDLSPLAPVIDVRATAELIDSYVFVIEWGRTKIGVVEHALSGAPGIYENLLGVALNKVDMTMFGRYETDRDYYYNKHYARYHSA
jgi:succinoglycan biosynthesis transport protein ExoP